MIASLSSSLCPPPGVLRRRRAAEPRTEEGATAGLSNARVLHGGPKFVGAKHVLDVL